METVVDEAWDKHDYVFTLADRDYMDESRPGGHAHNPLPEKHDIGVSMADIHGRHEAVRLQKRR
jgi:hypothetical protein